MSWNKITIQRECGDCVEAQAPIIVSASRSTDIPAFYADWFFHRLERGYSLWTNPFNGIKGYVSYQNTRFIVFWSKNPHSLLDYLHILEDKNIKSYIQYTLNDYEPEGLEKGVPSLEQRIATFKQLVEYLGLGRIIWRFDPLILTDKISVDDLLRKIEYIGDRLKGYTEKLVFSFADIAVYRKVKSNLDKNGINYQEWSEPMMELFASKLAVLNKKWNFQLSTCGEKIDIEKYGITHNKCIDDDLMIRFAHNDKMLMDYLKVDVLDIPQVDLFGDSPLLPDDAIKLDNGKYAVKKKNNKDKGQRQFCGCIVSKDIGEYNTCPHLCEYCYANTSKDAACDNYKTHQQNPNAETITSK